jgi:hypothetical protein
MTDDQPKAQEKDGIVVDLREQLATAEAEVERLRQCEHLQQDMNTIYSVANLTKERDEARKIAQHRFVENVELEQQLA